jgi:hypothetical protein
MMINMKKKKENNRDNRRDRGDNRGDNRRDNKKGNDIAEMHKLAQQLSRKNNNNLVEKQQINQQSDNTNYDLTDTISGIINNELNKL